MYIYIYIYICDLHGRAALHGVLVERLGGFEGSAAKGRFRNCCLTYFANRTFAMDP